ncbi:MAG: hypothetical protein A3I89_03025 [Candidatus Harrisonbacteria bacterium RIFCSPLOWO2_02_FULL_41_11]|uniref:Uncharacterized protein n=1 Tax=Candidatus Harrisonbacteria bacterium RIFCSPHIGHO2_02_FULL_42_16 TaxID=1798404 RepID=A0A1G1ZJT9_9BACT|nr:MAG: hypothetical protein A3B92_02475 [Candidatus Harrisonbacteria bacterium RIFCSPHIGHO2_02_FULL_42_16]OGY67378.1 MAG: hypothetical protein A3I89_03025 [Candidatus Harrisonbacteria bacterium RIFCSPLOWO2_02_FULL_41_11]
MKTFKNTDKAIKRLLLAKKRNEKIGIWGDYDPDGIPGAFIVYQALLKASYNSKNLTVVLPDQKKYGRSFHPFYLNFLKRKGVSLVIGIDFGGGSDFNSIKIAKEKGFDIIILDHHPPGPKKLPAILINPNQKGDSYPFKNWSGGGVAYKFFEFFYKTIGLNPKILEELLDAFAISMVADGIKEDGVNAGYLTRGINLINKKARLGIKMLLKVSQTKKVSKKIMLWGEDIDYVLRASIYGNNRRNNLFQLLLSEDCKKTFLIAKDVKKRLKDFKKAVSKIIFQGIEKHKKEKNLKALVMITNTKTSRALGMAAHKLVETLNVPVFLLKRKGKYYNGSARGGDNNSNPFNVLAGLNFSSKLLINFGGHKGASGFQIKKENIQKFEAAVKNYFSIYH